MFAMMENPQQFVREYGVYRDVILKFLPPVKSSDKPGLKRRLDLIHTCFFSREIVPGTLSYFTDEVLSNPAASIHDLEIDRVLRTPLPNLSSGWEKEIQQGAQRYRLFPGFVQYEPCSEIHLAPDFAEQLISDVHVYFEK